MTALQHLFAPIRIGAMTARNRLCLLYTSDAADDLYTV